MTEQKVQKASPVIVLPPPVLAESPLSSKYEMIFDLKWGVFEKQVKISRETYTFNQDLVKLLNEALVEGAESNPYIVS